MRCQYKWCPRKATMVMEWEDVVKDMHAKLLEAGLSEKTANALSDMQRQYYQVAYDHSGVALCDKHYDKLWEKETSLSIVFAKEMKLEKEKGEKKDEKKKDETKAKHDKIKS